MEKVKVIKYSAKTKQTVIEEVEMDLPSPRIGEIQDQLQKIQEQLQLTDYQSHKFADGDLTDAEYDPIRKERKALRAEYNQLEEELKALT